METETRVFDGMDILKGIRRGLRGRDESQESKHSRKTIDPQSDCVGRNSADDGDGPEEDSDGPENESDGPVDTNNAPADDSEESTDEGTESAASSERNMADKSDDGDHVCSFCQTEFDAERGGCPDCGAELVLRGDR